VHHLIYDHLTTGVAVEELMIAFDLTAAQIYAALAYYYDHSEEIDRLISEELEAFASLPDDPSQAELRARWEARLRSAPIPDPDQEMTVSEVAEVYGVTPQAVRAAAKRGALPARKSGSAWLIRRRDADYRWGRGSP
jgi:excisionase family DNA binding protein